MVCPKQFLCYAVTMLLTDGTNSACTRLLQNPSELSVLEQPHQYWPYAMRSLVDS
jgi:hypothetical protein